MNEAKTSICEECQREIKVRKSRGSGRILCYTCRIKTETIGLCKWCDKNRPIVSHIGGKATCQKCYHKLKGNQPKKSQWRQKTGICSSCGQKKKVSKNRKIQQLLCNSCYRKKFNTGLCSWCHQIGLIDKRTHLGKAICHKCYESLNVDDCILCGEMGVIQARNHDGKPICHKCYEKGRYHDESRHEECHICHEKKPVAARLDGLGPICLNCHQKHFYNPPKKKCYVCGKTKPIKLVTEKGNVCKTCYQREFNKERCTDCQKEKPVAYRREGKVLCRACRKKMRQQEQKGFNISQLRESKLISLVAV